MNGMGGGGGREGDSTSTCPPFHLWLFHLWCGQGKGKQMQKGQHQPRPAPRRAATSAVTQPAALGQILASLSLRRVDGEG